MRVSRLRPRRTARSLRRQLHRPRSRRHAAALVGPVPLQGAGGRVRPAGTARRQERALSQSRRRHVRRCLGGVRHHARERHLRPRRGTLDFDADGWVDVYVANDSNPSALYRNNRDGTFTDIATAAGCAYSQDGKAQAGMGLADRRLRSQRHDGHLQDELRRRHVDALREHRQGPVRGPHVRRRLRRQHALARLGRRLSRPRQRRLAGSLPRQRPRLSRGPPARRPKPATSSARSSTATCATAASPTSASSSARRSRRRRPAAARRSPTSTTTATSTSSSTTCTTRPISSGWIRPASDIG